MSEPTPEDIENLIEQFKRSDWEEMHQDRHLEDFFQRSCGGAS